MFLRIVIIITIYLLSSVVHGSTMDSIITINQTSTSGKTLLIDKGSNHTIAFDDYGVLLKSYIINKKRVFKPVAKMKAVKVFGERSIWVTFKVFIQEEIKTGSRLMLFSESALLQGRTNLKITRSKLVGHKNLLSTQVADSLKEGTEGLSKKEKNYRVEKKLHDREKHFHSDVDLVDLDAWADKAGNKNYKPVAIIRSPYAKEFSDRKRVETFEKMVVAFIRKYDDPKFSLKDMYYLQRKDHNIDTFTKRTAKGSYFDRYIENQEKQAQSEKKIFHDLQSKGESWSDGYSDEELSEMVYNIGAIKERERRATIAAHKFDHQFYGHFGLNLINNENLQDRRNTEQSKYDFEFGWEYYFLKDVELLHRFSMELNGRRAVDAFTIGNGYNVTSTESSIAGQINYYPFVKPSILERNIVYFGILFRTGLSRLKLADTNEEGNYQLQSIPGMRAGIKYNFSNSYGVRLQAGYENITVSRIIRTYDGGELPDRANYIEGKISVGLSKFY